MTQSLFVSNAKRQTWKKVCAGALALSLNLSVGGVGAALLTEVAYAHNVGATIGFTASVPSDTSVLLSWQSTSEASNSLDQHNLDIWYCVGVGCTPTVSIYHTTQAFVSSGNFLHTGLTTGQTYNYKIREQHGGATEVFASINNIVVTSPTPDTEITSAPSSSTNDTTATFEFTSTISGSTFECSLDEGVYSSCVSPLETPVLTEGEHTFSVRAVAAGVTDPTPATRTWTVDSLPPTVSITSPESNETTGPTGTVTYTAADASSVTCSLDTEEVSCDLGGSFAWSSLSNGSHTFEIVGTDAVGNSSSDSVTWTVDALGPIVTIISGPTDPSASTDATFVFETELLALTLCSIDSFPATACLSGEIYSNLADGLRTFYVNARDVFGNVGPTASYSWTIDTDQDDDGVVDGDDNCVNDANADQADMDEDGMGDVCDPDQDGDEVANEGDNCPVLVNSDQADADGDLVGDACDTDDDADTVLDGVDNCPTVSNENQSDVDEDGLGDACDTDNDNDGVSDSTDNCPLVANATQGDNDEDGMGDVCDSDDDNDGVMDEEVTEGETTTPADNCQLVENTDQTNHDDDGMGDVCDFDDDNDSVPDVETPLEEEGTVGPDNCQFTANADQADADEDGIGDVCDETPNGDTEEEEEVPPPPTPPVPPSGGGGSSTFDYWGCTNARATNFNSLANKDDGSCVLPGTTTVGGSVPPTESTGSTTPPPQGEVLGASTEAELPLPPECAANPYLRDYLKLGKKNDVEQVKLLQTFLNETMNAGLPVTGYFGNLTKAAVKKFQKTHYDEIIQPWVSAGFNAAPIKDGTGYVYKTTKRFINMTKCAALNEPMPELIPG